MSEISTIRPVYQFSFTDDNYITYTVYFLNESAEPGDGADHAAPHEMRRNFIRTITDSLDLSTMTNDWFPLPDHEFTDFLKQKSFQYNRFMVQVEPDNCWVYIE